MEEEEDPSSEKSTPVEPAEIDRKKLGSIVFADRTAMSVRFALLKLLHRR